MTDKYIKSSFWDSIYKSKAPDKPVSAPPPEVETSLRLCISCKRDLPFEYFKGGIKKTGERWYSIECKSCVVEKMRETKRKAAEKKAAEEKALAEYMAMAAADYKTFNAQPQEVKDYYIKALNKLCADLREYNKYREHYYRDNEADLKAIYIFVKNILTLPNFTPAPLSRK
jgi:hypothetical protein